MACERRDPVAEAVRGVADPVRLPTNFVTRRPYAGFNVLSLQLAAQVHGYPASLWGSFNQWRSAGGVREAGREGHHHHPSTSR